MTTFAIATLGCKVNAYESQGYAQGLNDLGFQEVSFKEKADIYIINTCAVTNTAASKSRQKVHLAKRLHAQSFIVMVGCYAQSMDVSMMSQLQVDLLVGSDHKMQLPQLIQDAYLHHKTQNFIHDMRKATVFEALPVRYFPHQTRAYLKIQDGCNQFCSYCIIPYARGAERSLAPDEVINRAKELIKGNHLEIVLTGIHTGRYGKEHACSLCALLKRICSECEGLERIRISSIEINEIGDDLLDLMANVPKIARHLHIPIQSADDEVLKRMNRPYSFEEYAKRIHQIREKIPNISISTDVITGFPQESGEQFQLGMQRIKSLCFSFLHVFPFSKRDGTKAAAMQGHLDNRTKKMRCTELMALSDCLSEAYQKAFIHKEVKVLWEKQEGEWMIGHTSEYLCVYAPYDAVKLHHMECVKIASFEDHKLLCQQEVNG